jgi:cytidylate kinase
MSGFVVAIDGPAGVGKTTVTKLLADKLGAAFLDTGAMYRAVTLAAMRKEIDLTNVDELLELMEGTTFNFRIEDGLMKVSIDNVDVTEGIRDPGVTGNVMYIASEPAIRARLVEMQRRFAADYPKIVTEGRDQGTVAFPQARFKFFLLADAGERARRRVDQLAEKGILLDKDEVEARIRKRDTSDENRDMGPLIPACDAIIIDTTELDAVQVVEQMLEYVRSKQ